MASLENTLSEQDRQILDFAKRTYGSVGAKERDIRQELQISSATYHVRLRRLMQNPAALAYAPAVISRLETVLEEKP